MTNAHHPGHVRPPRTQLACTAGHPSPQTALAGKLQEGAVKTGPRPCALPSAAALPRTQRITGRAGAAAPAG